MMAQCINVISPQCPVCTASPSAVHWSGRSFATLWYPAHSFSTRFPLPGIQNWWSSWYCWLYPQFCSWIPVWRRYNCIPLRSNPPYRYLVECTTKKLLTYHDCSDCIHYIDSVTIRTPCLWVKSLFWWTTVLWFDDSGKGLSWQWRIPNVICFADDNGQK